MRRRRRILRSPMLNETPEWEPPLAKFYFYGKFLENVKSHPYLGVEIDNRLRWKDHKYFMSSYECFFFYNAFTSSSQFLL